MFSNQRLKEEYYYFTNDAVMKHNIHGEEEPSTVSLNWLLDDKCEIEIVPANIVLKHQYRTIKPGELDDRLKEVKGEE